MAHGTPEQSVVLAGGAVYRLRAPMKKARRTWLFYTTD